MSEADRIERRVRCRSQRYELRQDDRSGKNILCTGSIMIEERRKIGEKYNFIGTLDMYLRGLKIAVLDIETSGLSPKKAHVIMVGMLIYRYPESGASEFIHLVAEEPGEEEDMLAKTAELLADVDIIITYNGNSFDIPFLKQRIEMHGAGCENGAQLSMFARPATELNIKYSLDLYEILHRYSNLRRFLPNLRQKTVEDYMGLWRHREDKASGADSVKMYFDYLDERKRGNKAAADELMRLMRLHNSDDVLQLARMPAIFDKFNHDRAFFETGFVANPAFAVDKIVIDDEALVISGRQTGAARADKFGSDDCGNFSMAFDKFSGLFEFRLPIIRKDRLICVDLKGLSRGAANTSACHLGRFEALGIYPKCSSGFLVIAEGDEINYRETNHFVIVFLDMCKEEFYEDKGET